MKLEVGELYRSLVVDNIMYLILGETETEVKLGFVSPQGLSIIVIPKHVFYNYSLQRVI